jgi:hypothetical protein
MTTNDSLALTSRDVLYALSPVGCFVEALSIGLLFAAIVGCFVSFLG